jgi:hypothetical protein
VPCCRQRRAAPRRPCRAQGPGERACTAGWRPGGGRPFCTACRERTPQVDAAAAHAPAPLRTLAAPGQHPGGRSSPLGSNFYSEPRGRTSSCWSQVAGHHCFPGAPSASLRSPACTTSRTWALSARTASSLASPSSPNFSYLRPRGHVCARRWRPRRRHGAQLLVCAGRLPHLRCAAPPVWTHPRHTAPFRIAACLASGSDLGQRPSGLPLNNQCRASPGGPGTGPPLNPQHKPFAGLGRQILGTTPDIHPFAGGPCLHRWADFQGVLRLSSTTQKDRPPRRGSRGPRRVPPLNGGRRAIGRAPLSSAAAPTAPDGARPPVRPPSRRSAPAPAAPLDVLHALPFPCRQGEEQPRLCEGGPPACGPCDNRCHYCAPNPAVR